MNKTLILTEKPSVAIDFVKTLNVQGKEDGFFENDDYIITFAVGHLVELFFPEDYKEENWKTWSLNTLPILPNKFQYKPVKNAKKQLKIVCNQLNRKDIDKIIIATDAGREGELIARTILDYAKVPTNDNLYRFWTSQALTPQVIRQELKYLKPATRYQRLYDAGQNRQCADWIIGMNLSRLATLKINNGDVFSVGRVQTAVLSMLVDRKRAIEEFKPEPYWTFHARFSNDKGSWLGDWYKEDVSRFQNYEDVAKLSNNLENKKGRVVSATKKKKKKSPPQLFSLTVLQQEANNKFGYTAQQTLNLAQSLYEKRKCLSYPRTDSRVLGSQNVNMVKDIVSQLKDTYQVLSSGIDETLIHLSNKHVFNDQKLTDHHALIPLKALPDNVSESERNVFELVLTRFFAVFYPDMEYLSTEVITTIENETFRTKGRVVLIPGWQKLYPPDNSKQKNKDPEQNIPDLMKDDIASVADTIIKSKKTVPLKRFTEASLLQEMTNPGKYTSEEDLKKIFKGDIGLGTQATRAQIIETLLKRKYIERSKKILTATGKGCFLVDTFRKFPSSNFLTTPKETARWEMKLESIAHGNHENAEFLKEIKEVTMNVVNEVRDKDIDKYNIPKTLVVVGSCPSCEKEVIDRGTFYGCSGWKKDEDGCKFAIWKKIAGKSINEKVVETLLKNHQTDFLKGFTAKNKKKFSAKLKLSNENQEWKVTFDFEKDDLGLKCPVCGGDIFESQKSYGCSNWKEKNCKFVIWKKIAGKEISESILKNLIENRETSLIKGFKSKKDKDKKFSAKLKLVQEDQEWKTIFDFENDKEMPTCPACGGNIFEGKKSYGCSNWKEKDCKFVIWKKIAGKSISMTTVSKLIEKGETAPLKGFISKNKKKFTAKLKLVKEEQDWKVVFDF